MVLQVQRVRFEYETLIGQKEPTPDRFEPLHMIRWYFEKDVLGWL